MKTFSITLPTPPSYHQCQGKSRKGGYKTKKYKAWLLECSLELTLKFKGNKQFKMCDFNMEVYNERINADIDNYIKQWLDLAVMCEVIPDDCRRYVRSVRSSWTDTVFVGKGNTLLTISGWCENEEID